MAETERLGLGTTWQTTDAGVGRSIDFALAEVIQNAPDNESRLEIITSMARVVCGAAVESMDQATGYASAWPEETLGDPLQKMMSTVWSAAEKLQKTADIARRAQLHRDES